MNKNLWIAAAVLVIAFNPLQRAFSGKLVDFPQGDAAWAIEVRLPASARKAREDSRDGPDVKEAVWFETVVVTRVGGLRRDQITWTDGSRSETWWCEEPGFVMFEDPRIEKVVALPPDVIFDEMRLDETAFRWITPSSFVRETAFEGRKCLLYEGAAYQYEEGEGGRYRVWIEKESLMPVALENKDGLYVFKFLEPSAETLIMPPHLSAMLDRFKRAMAPAPPLVGKRGGRH